MGTHFLADPASSPHKDTLCQMKGNLYHAAKVNDIYIYIYIYIYILRK